MRQTSLIALLTPVFLVLLSFWQFGLAERLNESKQVKSRLAAAEQQLIELQAQEVAYRQALRDFSAATGMEFESEEVPTRGRVAGQVGRVVDAVVEAVRAQEASFEETEPALLTFKSVTPGARSSMDRFLLVDFHLNLEGRFHALPQFLSELSRIVSRISKEENCAISFGREISIASENPGGKSGYLLIKFPLRVYLLER